MSPTLILIPAFSWTKQSMKMKTLSLVLSWAGPTWYQVVPSVTRLLHNLHHTTLPPYSSSAYKWYFILELPHFIIWKEVESWWFLNFKIIAEKLPRNKRGIINTACRGLSPVLLLGHRYHTIPESIEGVRIEVTYVSVFSFHSFSLLTKLS